MKKSMNLFGEALWDYSQGGKKIKFYLVDEKGNKGEQPIKHYFRNYKQFSIIEKKIISLSHGEILDVGCGTGNYIPYLMKKGSVLGIDISNKAIKIAKNKGLNCKVKDIFKLKTNKKFDTITLLQNNLGMAETVPKAKTLLKILSNILKNNGQILTNGKEITNKKFYSIQLCPLYKNKKGKKFRWLNINSNFLKELCNSEKLKLEILDRDEKNYLARITKE